MVIGLFSVNQQGDIGGVGVSRFAVQNAAGTTFSNVELNAVAAALAQLYTSWKGDGANPMSYIVSPIANMVDVASGALDMQQNIPTTATIVASGSGTYAAGVGGRIYWHTTQVRGRRLMRGATYFAPMAGTSFTNQGVISSTSTGRMTTAATAYIAAITAMGGMPLVWGRPTKKGAVDGVVGVIASATMTNVPASLRSRRN